MFFKKEYEDRLRIWHDFRQTLETEKDPIQTAITFYDSIPNDNMCADPYSPETWPNPWELVQENQYCAFTKLLGIGFSLQLTDRFSQEKFEIHICIDRKNSNHYYLLYIGNEVIGFDNYRHIEKLKLPQGLESQMTYSMPTHN
jgi:hypothetical protein